MVYFPNKMATPLHTADRALSEISRATHLLSFLNPTNLHEEEQEFFTKPKYEPQFSYKRFTRAEGLRTRINAINIVENTPLGRLFRNVKEQLLIEIKMLENLGTTKFTDIRLYGTPSKTLINKAHNILQKIPRQPLETKPHAATYLKTVFEKELIKYGFTGWIINIKPTVSGVAVSPSKRSIVIKNTAMFSANDIKCLMAHEIGAHIIRTMNGYRQHYEIFSTDAVPRYLQTEEGIAALHEKKAGCLTNNRLRKYAGRVIAASLAQKQGFRQVYNELSKYFTPKEAFAMTVRVKRGLADTSQPGGFIKDHVYYEGMLLLEDFIAHGGKITPLYAGKIGLAQISFVEEEILLPPNYLPKF